MSERNDTRRQRPATNKLESLKERLIARLAPAGKFHGAALPQAYAPKLPPK
jgi:hypothetical protein